MLTWQFKKERSLAAEGCIDTRYFTKPANYDKMLKSRKLRVFHEKWATARCAVPVI